jgi:uncharacterized membrane protein YGL010W
MTNLHIIELLYIHHLKITTMRTLQQLLDKYGESHQNTSNKLIHWVCVPAIFFSIIGLFYAIPLPTGLEKNLLVSWATVVIIVVYIYYLRLSWVMFVAFIGWGLFCLWGNCMMYEYFDQRNALVAYCNLGIFAVAWIFQFIGHKIEGKKPSFLEDLQFLLIGPAWLLHFVLKRLGVKY